MLGQAEFGEVGPAIAFLAALVLAFGPGARGLTWIVDRVRDAVPFGDNPKYKIVWPLLAFAIALLIVFGWDVNIVGALGEAVPGLKDTAALNGWLGQLLTALGLAGFASTWHDRDVAKNPPTPTA